jgi:hypothetical protein
MFSGKTFGTPQLDHRHAPLEASETALSIVSPKKSKHLLSAFICVNRRPKEGTRRRPQEVDGR